jgi:hypothetical protein
MPDIPRIRCRLYASATQNEKWEEGYADAVAGRPNNAGFYKIRDLRAAYTSGYRYGRARLTA